jgi:hypothetical protein
MDTDRFCCALRTVSLIIAQVNTELRINFTEFNTATTSRFGKGR